MDIEELRQKQTDAINVLKRFKTIEALDWLIECRDDENPNFIIKESGEWSGLKIKRHISFQSGDSTYDLYLLDERMVGTYDGEDTWGDFQLYFDSYLVLETSYTLDREDWGSKRHLNWSISSDYKSKDGKFYTFDGAIKTIKLSEWVETLPRIVKHQKREIENRSKDDQREKSKKIVSEMTDKVDLGKYK